MRSAHHIMEEALNEHEPVAIFAGFSGGTDSLAVTHWLFENYAKDYPVRAFHANTGIGVTATRNYVRKACEHYGWPLTEIHAKDDCGQDYDELVRQWGFPGPAHHRKMYARLKERCVEELLRRTKTRRMDRVMLVTGIRHDESRIRAGYGDRVINRKGAQVWVNPLYWWTGTDKHNYIVRKQLWRNPVSDLLGMSGECLCGAYAHEGEKEMIRLVDPETVDRIERLEAECRQLGFDWGWEGRPPRGGSKPAENLDDEPMCVDCAKAGRSNDHA